MKHIFLSLALGIAILFGMGIGTETAKELFKAIYPKSTDKNLHDLSLKINVNLPKMVDDQTRLDRTVSEAGRKFTFFHSLPFHKSSDIDSQKIHDFMEPIIREKYCTSADMKNFIKYDVTTSFVYRGNDGLEVTRFIIKPKDCEQVIKTQ
ncbi:Uncharacterised protein [Delftia tsuruhatensis]|uniref:hypothetical protein n=1 Tax=Delftia tsuruhatensis TaxID=180282 RepID=UPI001E6CB9D0|nr:hypothetical protein [Delftia tsuruhatensis]CAB5721073.1 Uncharacterised protein [Delftia tsuruhatensis]CAC9688076.1 Uncharacterised protein [Delftia tsuruhatensis]